MQEAISRQGAKADTKAHIFGKVAGYNIHVAANCGNFLRHRSVFISTDGASDKRREKAMSGHGSVNHSLGATKINLGHHYGGRRAAVITLLIAAFVLLGGLVYDRVAASHNPASRQIAVASGRQASASVSSHVQATDTYTNLIPLSAPES